MYPVPFCENSFFCFNLSTPHSLVDLFCGKDGNLHFISTNSYTLQKNSFLKSGLINFESLWTYCRQMQYLPSLLILGINGCAKSTYMAGIWMSVNSVCKGNLKCYLGRELIIFKNFVLQITLIVELVIHREKN